MSQKDILEISIVYNINKGNEKDKKNLRIFGYDFVENNKKNCKMIIDNKKYEITEKYDITNFNNNKLEIKLKGIDNVTKMSKIFSECHHYHHYLIFQNGLLIMLLI